MRTLGGGTLSSRRRRREWTRPKIEVRSRPPRSEAFVPESSRSPACSASPLMLMPRLTPPLPVLSVRSCAYETFRAIETKYRDGRKHFLLRMRERWNSFLHLYLSILEIVKAYLFSFFFKYDAKKKWNMYESRYVILCSYYMRYISLCGLVKS